MAPFCRLFAVAGLVLSWSSTLAAQTYNVPQSQGGQTSPVVGTPGQGSSGSTTDVNRPGSSPAVGLKGSIGAYGSAPVIKDGAVSGPAGPDDFSLKSAAADAPKVLRQAVPDRVKMAGSLAVTPPSSPAANPVQGKTEAATPLESLIPAAGGLEETVAEIQKSREGSGPAADGAVEASLDKIFDLARQAAKKTMGAADFASVIGSMMGVENKIRRTVGVANTSSAKDAPNLYRSAIGLAKESFPPKTAEAVGKTVLASADKKADTALPALADEAVTMAAAGSKKGVDQALKSLDDWEGLLGAPGRPFIQNLSHLKSYVQGIFSGAGVASKGGSRRSGGQAVAGGAVRQAAVGAASYSPGDRVPAANADPEGQPGRSGSALDRVWFKRSARSRAVSAVLPGSAVASIPALAVSFDLGSPAALFGAQDDAVVAFRSNPTAGNGFKLVYRAMRREGAGPARGFTAAAVYWTKAVLARVYAGFKRFLRSVLMRAPGPRETARLAAEESGEYLAAKSLLAQRAGTLTMPAVEELLRRASRMASIYERLSADAGGLGAVSDIRARVERDGLGASWSSADPLPASAARWVVAADGHSLAYWIERIHGLTASRAAAAGAAVAGPGEPDLGQDVVPAVSREGRAGIGGVLERLLADVEARRGAAAGSAGVLSAFDPSAARYADLGRVGGMMAQGLRLRLKDGRLLALVLLRDPELGHIAFARAELAGSTESLPAKRLSSLLRLD
ncbi:MAG: hypothetical protein HY927_03395 [Elusimicrobia bacterium]|nr:hypothetical protein [Elusimicrobiota bacterium]